MIVKIFDAGGGKATIVKGPGGERIDVVLDETLRNKMCRRGRAFFEAEEREDGNVAIRKRLPDQKW